MITFIRFQFITNKKTKTFTNYFSKIFDLFTRKKNHRKKRFFNNNIIYRIMNVELIHFVQISNSQKIVQIHFFFYV